MVRPSIEGESTRNAAAGENLRFGADLGQNFAEMYVSSVMGPNFGDFELPMVPDARKSTQTRQNPLPENRPK